MPETTCDLRRAPSCGPECFEQCYVFRIPTHKKCYTPTANYRLVEPRLLRASIPARHLRYCSQLLISSASHLTSTEIAQANCPTIAMNAGEFGRASQSDHHGL